MAKHLVFIMEMGHNFGHISPLNSIACSARAQGYKISFVLPSISLARYISLDASDVEVHRSPVPRFADTSSNLDPVCYAENLLLLGYTQVDALAKLLGQWRRLIKSLNADILVFDFAPTAQLASLNIDVKKIMFGVGFCTLPEVSPMPAFSSQTKASTLRLERAETSLLAAINRSLNILKWPPLNRVADIFCADKKLLSCLPMFDTYREYRQTEQYCGFVYPSMSGKSSPWPVRKKSFRVFAYLNIRFPFLDALLAYLECKFDVKIVISNFDLSRSLLKDDPKFINNPYFELSNSPFDMKEVLPDCDFIVCHGGMGLSGFALQCGLPVIAIPLQVEQQLNADAIQEAGLGAALGPCDKWQEIEQAFDAIDFVALQKNTHDYAINYAKQWDEQATIEIILKTIADLA